MIHFSSNYLYRIFKILQRSHLTSILKFSFILKHKFFILSVIKAKDSPLFTKSHYEFISATFNNSIYFKLNMVLRLAFKDYTTRQLSVYNKGSSVQIPYSNRLVFRTSIKNIFLNLIKATVSHSSCVAFGVI